MIALALPLLALAGCESFSQASHAQTSASLDAGFGESLKYNAAIQTINPDPVYAESGAQPGDSGAKGAAAVRRYRTDSVKDVEVLTTTESSGSGSGPN
jgi:hypothetical protein